MATNNKFRLSGLRGKRENEKRSLVGRRENDNLAILIIDVAEEEKDAYVTVAWCLQPFIRT